MQSALIISSSDKNNDALVKILLAISCPKVSHVNSSGEARRLIQSMAFDLYIINCPLNQENGVELSLDLIANDTSQVLMMVRSEDFDYISNKVENAGVLTLAKPFNKGTLYSTLKLLKATHSRLSSIHSKNKKLTRKIEDAKYVDRAKAILIAQMSMSEEQAHKYIEKKAMDSRTSRREICETILRTYEY